MTEIKPDSSLTAKIRVACFIDGFNLYHAIHALKRDELKWVNLRTLMECFIDPNIHELKEIYYFSAHATWLPDEYRRHKAYVKALEWYGITPIMGNFKEKNLKCFECSQRIEIKTLLGLFSQ